MSSGGTVSALFFTNSVMGRMSSIPLIMLKSTAVRYFLCGVLECHDLGHDVAPMSRLCLEGDLEHVCTTTLVLDLFEDHI